MRNWLIFTCSLICCGTVLGTVGLSVETDATKQCNPSNFSYYHSRFAGQGAQALPSARRPLSRQSLIHVASVSVESRVQCILIQTIVQTNLLPHLRPNVLVVSSSSRLCYPRRSHRCSAPSTSARTPAIPFPSSSHHRASGISHRSHSLWLTGR
ncbi:hypothetical protein IWZ00DRAFT_512113 [Phyllosticta capitalensis]